jgi:hypothetical protein
MTKTTEFLQRVKAAELTGKAATEAHAAAVEFSDDKAVVVLSDWALLSCELKKARQRGIDSANSALSKSSGPIHFSGVDVDSHDPMTYAGQLSFELHSEEVNGWNHVFGSEENARRFVAIE